MGQTPKPHLVSYRERLVVDGNPISAADFADVVTDALEAADGIAARYGPPTEFEVLTAAAFAWFRRAEVEVAVVEVGLGGRLDATNVWQGGVSAITNVALDHMEYLGDTIELIAREKAQIIKRGDIAAVTGASGSALVVIARRTSRVKVPLRVVEPLPVISMDREAVHVLAPDGAPMRIGLLGRHQAANAAVALGIIDSLANAGIATVARDRLEAAFEAVRWPGRLEIISRPGRPDMILDGAHNPHAIAALAVALSELLPQISSGSATLLMGVLANHWQDGMLDPLSYAVPGAALIATRVPDATGSLEPRRLALAWGAAAADIADPARALDSALERASKAGGPLIVCGSLYLVGYVRAQLERAGAFD